MNAQSNIAASPLVYQRIAAVQGALARHGIGKDRTNSTPGANYKFRGIDDVYNALAPLLAEHGLCILPRVIGHSLTERGKTQKGNPIFSAVVDAEFDFVAAEDGSVHTIRTFGEAMDSSDKATNKAMSAAYKYAAFMAFAIPTEGDNDADGVTHEIVTDPARPITDAQWAQIVQLCQATGTQGDEVKAQIGAANLKVLSEGQLNAALDFLETKLATAAKAETDAKAKEPA